MTAPPLGGPPGSRDDVLSFLKTNKVPSSLVKQVADALDKNKSDDSKSKSSGDDSSSSSDSDDSSSSESKEKKDDD
eukprot:CAMPEP_0119202344 /NCGR_PEP_ID=MMETSP1316-20130426/31783_1 /TAXON_ID=41880 /ORGANISM="Pycnococcus provasolii, Strain RCC2336" /LENGTH=75 /DNA_ID=CAMNT_0007198533 /DNA_START=22 /DNA_END=246 /DNA_ORIENTATION=+